MAGVQEARGQSDAMGTFGLFYWETPYASELQCVENAANMTALFLSLYQKTLRQFKANRMIKLKLLKIKAETRKINAQRRQIEARTHPISQKDVG